MNKSYTSKFYTTPKQSEKLLKFLSPNSADMRYSPLGGTHPWVLEGNLIEKDAIPCWSLQALLDEIPNTIMNKQEEDLKLHIDKEDYSYGLFYENEYTGNMFEIETDYHDNFVDACVEMLLKLNKKKLL